MVNSFIRDKNVMTIFTLSAIAGLSAEGFLTINAQFLVALCFFFFIIFAYLNIKDMVSLELEDRANLIHKELEEAYRLKSEILNTVLSYYKKQLNLKEDILSIYEFSKNQVNQIISSRKKALEFKLMNDVLVKLDTVLLKEKTLSFSMQKEVIDYIVSQILNASKEDIERLDKESVEEAILMIQNISLKR